MLHSIPNTDPSNSIPGVEKSLKEKSNLIIEVTDLIEPMRALFVKMQAAYASQTKEYSAFVEDIHARQRESGVALEVAKDEITVLETVTEHLRNELVRMKQEYTLNHNELEGQLSAERDGRTQQQKELELVKEEWEREREATEKQFQAKKDQLVSYWCLRKRYWGCPIRCFRYCIEKASINRV